MGLIITQEEIEADAQRRKDEFLKLQAVYDSDSEVREIADKIHNSRMMPPPTCAQCIAMAIKRLSRHTYAPGR